MTQPSPARLTRRFGVAVVLTVLLAGCATTPASNPKDPFEKFNRAMLSFNDSLDEAAVKPVATAYKTYLPGFVQKGIGNFFSNLQDVWSGANNLMQGKAEDGLSDFSRFVVNSTFGIGGLFDFASQAGLRKHSEDFGQTLGYWGVPSGPYLMLPFLGASTLRDTVVMPIDRKADLWSYKDPVNVRNIGTVVGLVDQRASLLDASTLLEEAALDRYEFIRDSYLQRRQNKVFDGETSRKKAQEAAREQNRLDSEQSVSEQPANKPAADKAAGSKPAAQPAGSAAPAAPLSSETKAEELTPTPVADTSSGSQAQQ